MGATECYGLGCCSLFLMLMKLKRQDAVEELYNEFALRIGIRDLLSKIYDIEHLAGKIGCKSANAKDLIALSSSLKIIPVIKEKLKDVQSWVLKEISVNLDPDY